MFILSGCVEVEEPETSTVESEICTASYACTNSAGLLHYGMHELSLLGHANGQNAIIAPGSDGRPEIHKAGQRYRLDVVDGQIIGLDAVGHWALSGDLTVGAEFSIIDATSKARLFELRIDRHRLSQYDNFSKGPLHLYAISWHLPKSPPSTQQNACNPYVWPTPPNSDQLMGMEADEVLLFGLERVNVPNKTLSPNIGDTAGWITFGCAGNALAKLDLSGNTRHRQLPTFDDWKGRQATLKLYVADYCNNGVAVTVTGTPLVWLGPYNGYADLPNGGVEARWSENGAACLNTPRLVAHPDPSFPAADVAAALAACSIPTCTNNDVSSLAGYVRVSANYFPM